MIMFDESLHFGKCKHETIASASSITQSLTGELLDGRRKLIAMVSTGSSTAFSPAAMQATSGLIASLPNMVEAPPHVDPRKELARLISDGKYEEAFNSALQLADVTLFSWLCSQVDLKALCTMVPIRLYPLAKVYFLRFFSSLLMT